MGNRLWPIIFLPIALDIYCTMSRTVSQDSRLFSHKSQRNDLKTCRIYFFLATHLIHLYKDDIAHPPKDQVGFGDNHQYWYKLFNNKTIGWSRSKAGSAATTASISMFTWNWNNSYKNNLFYNLDNFYLPGVRKKGDIKRGYWIN